MFKRIPLLLSCLLISLATLAMDNDVYYVRFVENAFDQEGLLTEFPKRYLDYMKLFKDMKIDLKEAGSLEHPFQLQINNASPEDFDIFIDFLDYTDSLKNFTVNQPVAVIDTAVTRYFLSKDVKNIPNYYTVLAKIIKVGNFLELDPKIMEILLGILKKAPKKKVLTIDENFIHESIEGALNAGLKDINTLPLELLEPVKKSLVKDIVTTTETFVMKALNETNYKHPKVILNVPDQYKQIIKYGKVVSREHAYMHLTNGIMGVLSFKTKTNTPPIMPFDHVNPIQYPSFNTLGDVPNQHLISNALITHRINPRVIAIGALQSAAKTYVESKGNYFSYSFYDHMFNNVEIAVSGILNIAHNKWISIPNQLAWFDLFIDKDNKEKIVSIVGTTNDTPKIVVIDPISGICSILKDFPTINLIGATVLGSKLIYRYYKKNSDAEQISYLETIDLHTQKVIQQNELKSGYREAHFPLATYSTGFSAMSASYNAEKTIVEIQLIQIIRENFSESLKGQRSQFYLDADNFKFLSTTRDVSMDPSHNIAKAIPQLASKIIFIDLQHPDLKNLQQPSVFITPDRFVCVGGIDQESKNFVIYSYLNPTMIAIFDQIKQRSYLSIEQLYVIADIADSITLNQFIEMPPAEKQIFESMALEDQNLFLNLFSKDKPITDTKGRQFIVNPQKAGAYETPLKGYIKEQSRGQKRAAEESPDEERPAKKQKRTKSGEGEESEEDETTLDESEDN